MQHRGRSKRILLLGCVLALAPVMTSCTTGGPKTPTPVVVIVLENKVYENVLGNSQAPFINTMIRHGRLFTHYTAQPSSLPNYLVMTAGNARVVPNSLSGPVDAPNLFNALGTQHTWASYEESMPWRCFQGTGYGTVKGVTDPLYKKGHNPAVYFSNVTTNPTLCHNDVPMELGFNPSALPEFSLVVPNTCNDMHSMPADDVCPMWNGNTNRGNNELKLGDNWLSAFVPQIASKATVILTFDEGSNANEHIVTLEYGKGVTPGTDATAYAHPSLEAGLYRRFGLGPAPAAGATATPLPIP